MSVYQIFTVVFLLFFSHSSDAQLFSTEELIAAWKVEDVTQTIRAEDTYADLRVNFNKERVSRVLRELHKEIDNSRNERLKIRLAMYEILAAGNENPMVRDFAFDKGKLLEMIKVAKQLEDKQLLSELYSLFSNARNTSIEEAILYYTKLIEIQEQIGVEYFPRIYSRYLFLSPYLYEVGLYRQSLLYGLTGLQVQSELDIRNIDAVCMCSLLRKLMEIPGK